MKTICINDVDYELVTKTVGERIKDELTRASYKGLWDCYKSASKCKQEVIKEWDNIMGDLCIQKNCGVLSFNSMTFTLGFIFNYDGHIAYAKITPMHNYIYIV